MFVPLALVILALATARGTRLVVEDYITEPIRSAVIRRFGAESKLTYLVHCTYCTSIWVGGLAALFACLVLAISWWWLVPLALAFSQAAVFASQWDR
jgi:fatty acid desaturase